MTTTPQGTSAISDDQIFHMTAFARGQLSGPDFEQWLLKQDGLQNALGDELHWSLLSAPYGDRDEVWRLRQLLGTALERLKTCECATVDDIAAISTWGDFDYAKFFGTFDKIIVYGVKKWWLYISKCRCCGSVWLVSSDSRIYDQFFIKRIDEATLSEARAGKWPKDFLTYEDVLSTGRKLCTPPRFCDPMAHGLQFTVEDLLAERPAITSLKIAHLLGLSEQHAAQLVEKVTTLGVDTIP